MVVRRPTRLGLGLALAATVATLGAWLLTGRHAYTKFEVVERVNAPIDEEDPLAGTGFYEEPQTPPQTGLLETDQFARAVAPAPADPRAPADLPPPAQKDETAMRTLRKKEFHLGVLPVPQGLFDKHLLSVATLLGVVWGAAFLLGSRSRGRSGA